MIRVWRICKKKYAAFDGEGARWAGGRWNHRGTAIVYTSATLSLAALEYLVNVDATDGPADLTAVSADIPDSISLEQLDIADLPPNWRVYPAPESLADLGTRWAREGRTAMLVVPSAVIPQERNYLLNPAHSNFKTIRVGSAEPFSFDPRTWKRP
ncbi:MAG: RES family NAD+ phosphorylase [Candidatus Rokubacteria bacterium]|nr:RES family NAD+ phosphorylase [Candidatus Rokubacteria bacterium]